MSYEAVRWAMYDAPMLLTAAGKPDTAARAVLIARAERADKHGRNTFAGTADLIQSTGYDERTIERAERRLEEAGLLIRAGRSRLGTVLWHVDMAQKKADDNQAISDARIERRRKADAVRQQRARERRKITKSDANSTPETGQPIEPDVSTKIRVTDSASVSHAFEIRDVTDSASVTSRTQRPPNHPYKTTQLNHPGTTPGGAPPPDPRRRPPPPASATDERKSPSVAPTPAQDQQGDSLPRTRAREHGPPDLPRLADVIPIENWRTA